jgi:hypothetical protein
MDPETVLEDCAVEVSSDSYAVLTTNRPHDVSGAFATIDDGREVTHVVTEDRLADVEPLDVERGWALLTFDAVLPFELVGFLAVVATALAERDVSIFALSAYSTDHVLVKTVDVERALEALSELGCEIHRA